MMVGIPGSGKSTFAESFADTFQAPIVSQTTLQRTYGLSLDAAKLLRDSLLVEFIKTKHTLIIDGGLDTKEEREILAKQLTKKGYRPMLIWVQTDTNEAFRRASKEYPRGSGLSGEAFDSILDTFEPPHEREKATVISGKHTYDSQLKIVLKQLATGTTAQPKYRQVAKPSVQPRRVAAQVSTDAVKPTPPQAPPQAPHLDAPLPRSQSRNNYRR